ncbi:unnamed protein product [Cuscuta campestris]|uniref:RBR-type E3 ubiquitin transferase n=1 Tax=Cuscuta campestris TaxID=132261 RepID=A0A484NCZ8_9ASTE|nr:unnamed protein product [Cuscuta campestris]
MATFTASQPLGRTRAVTLKRKYEDGQPSGVKRHAQEVASICSSSKLCSAAGKGKYSQHHHHHADEGKNITKKSGSHRPSKFQCAICFEEEPMSDGFEIKVCHHVFCATCMTTYVATKIRQNVVKVTCPTPKCPSELKPRHLQTILPREVIDRWETARCESTIAESQKTYCPFNDCSVLLVDDGGEVVTSAECPSCHRLFCAQCRVPWHGMMTCREFQRKKNMNKNEQDLDKKFFKLAEKKMWQKCPSARCLCRDEVDVNTLNAGVEEASATTVGINGILDIYARNIVLLLEAGQGRAGQNIGDFVF